MADRVFLNVSDWIERFESDPMEVLKIRDEWMMHATDHVDDPGVSDVAGEFVGMTRVLTTWADRTGIDGASVLWELCRQLCAVRNPGPPWGQRQPREVIEETMCRALGLIDRITDAAMRSAAVEPNRPAQFKPPPLTEHEQWVLDLIAAQPKGTAITGPRIISAIGVKHHYVMEQSTLTKHIIPKLKRWYSVKSRPRVGYYIDSA